MWTNEYSFALSKVKKYFLLMRNVKIDTLCCDSIHPCIMYSVRVSHMDWFNDVMVNNPVSGCRLNYCSVLYGEYGNVQFIINNYKVYIMRCQCIKYFVGELNSQNRAIVRSSSPHLHPVIKAPSEAFSKLCRVTACYLPSYLWRHLTFT